MGYINHYKLYYSRIEVVFSITREINLYLTLRGTNYKVYRGRTPVLFVSWSIEKLNLKVSPEGPGATGF